MYDAQILIDQTDRLMDIHHLKVFQAVARTGSFTQAGKNLNLSQSTISQHIKHLEAELDCQLFVRIGKQVLITEVGRVLLEHSAKILHDLSTAKLAVREANGLHKGVLRFGSGATTLIYQLPPVLKNFKSQNPSTELVIETSITEEIIAKVKSQRLDLGLVMLPIAESGLQVVPLCYEELLVAVSSEHPFAEKPTLSVRNLATLPFILYERKTVMRKLIEDFFAALGVAPRVVTTMENIEAIKSLVGAGLGASILPEHAVGDEVGDKKICLLRVGGHPLRRHLGLIRLKSNFTPQAVHNMIDMITAELSST